MLARPCASCFKHYNNPLMSVHHPLYSTRETMEQT